MDYLTAIREKPLKIILIDDSETDYMLTREYLASASSQKYDLDWSSSYEEGLKRIESEVFDLCLMDHQLGSKSGVDLAQEIRKNGFENPIIMFSGCKLEDIKNGAKNHPFEGYISKKGISTQAIVSEIERHISIPQALTTEPESLTIDETNISQIIVENLPDPIMLLDENGNIIMANKVFCEMVALEPDDLLNVNASLILNCKKRTLLDALTSGIDRHSFSTKIKKTNMKGRQIHWRFNPINVPNAPQIKAIAQGDVKNRKARNKNLIKTIGLLGRYFSSPSYIKCNNIYYNRDIFK